MKLKSYVDSFNAGDEEIYSQAIPNEQAYEWLSREIPRLECPDEELERIYHFRWWTLRKHWKETPHGHVMTEFLPPVPWAGPYNTINCPLGHHIREGRWLSDENGWMKEYIRFWLNGHGDALSYSTWLATAVEEYCQLRGETAFEAECIDALCALYERWEVKALQPCGLFWSNDGRDGMEFSISGSGLRPTLNTYLWSDACAIARMARRAGRSGLAETYQQKADRLAALIEEKLWDGDFYRVQPCEPGGEVQLDDDHRVRELIGLIPWAFGLAPRGREDVFAQLMDEEGFFAPCGLTTAERRHPRFGFFHEHECLWNGPSWPFATSQTLVAAARLVREYPPTPHFTKDDYWTLLKQYAHAHQLDGKPWIDENYDAFTGEWIARRELMADGWKPARGGYERGKDYNHSLFCDLVLSGLLGIGTDAEGRLTADPIVPDSWDFFRVTHLRHGDAYWRVEYHRETGVTIAQE